MQGVAASDAQGRKRPDLKHMKTSSTGGIGMRSNEVVLRLYVRCPEIKRIATVVEQHVQSALAPAAFELVGYRRDRLRCEHDASANRRSSGRNEQTERL